jgi:predicted AAA+ superfamily ATPase
MRYQISVVILRRICVDNHGARMGRHPGMDSSLDFLSLSSDFGLCLSFYEWKIDNLVL